MQAISRHHVMSPVAQAIAKRALEQLSKSHPQSAPVPANPLKAGKILLNQLGDNKFAYQGFGLYSLATEDESIPTIWRKETVKDPRTGTETEWLVAYTTDDDDIVRGLASSADLMGVTPQNVPNEMTSPDMMTEHTRVFQPSTGLHGTVTRGGRLGIDKVVWVAFDETGETKAVPTHMLEAMGSQRVASVNVALRAIAEPKLPKNQMPIAPGVINKNLTLDQDGQGGKATVTVEFNDPAKGEDFFKQIEDLTSEVGGTTTAPALPKEEKPESTPPATEGAPAGNEAKEQAPPTPIPAGAPAQAPLASTVRNLTHYGAKIVTIVAEKFEGYSERYHFVNEDGVRIALNLSGRVKVGSSIIRPDNGEKIRVIGYQTVETANDDIDIVASLVGTSVDISDKVPPMGWTNKDSQNESDEAGNKPLPPNPALQADAPPSADTSQPPVYDSQQAKGDPSQQKFNMSVNPSDNSVTVKFEKPPALQELDEAVQGVQPQLDSGVTPQPAQQGQQSPTQPQTQQKQDFSQAESPIQF